MLANADGSCTLSVHSIRPAEAWQFPDVVRTELVSDVRYEAGTRHGMLVWLDVENLNPELTQFSRAIRAVRFSVDAGGQFSKTGGVETLIEILEDRTGPIRSYFGSGFALSSDGSRLAFLEVSNPQPWPSEGKSTPMVCALPGCATPTAVADPGWYLSPAWGQDGALHFIRRGPSSSELPDDSAPWIVSASVNEAGQWTSRDLLELKELAGGARALEITRSGLERLAIQENDEPPDRISPVRIYTRQAGNWNPDSWAYAFDQTRSLFSPKWTRRGQLSLPGDEALLFGIFVDEKIIPWEWAPASGSAQESMYPAEFRSFWDAD